MKKHRISVDLRIVDLKVNPSIITDKLGIVPTKTWVKGQRVSEKISRAHDSNGWLFSPDVPQEIEFEELMRHLMDIFESKKETLKEISESAYIELSIALYLYYDNDEDSIPWIHFTKPEMDMLNAIGAEVDFDIYVLPSEVSSN